MKCGICEIGCEIAEGRTGRCRMYTCENGVIAERFPHSYMALLPISIETMPILHFHPRSTLLQVCSIGCNFTCPGCISEILTTHVDAVSGSLTHRSAEAVVQRAQEEQAAGITFCLNDPIVAHYSFMDLARTASEAGLCTGCSTNGYYTRDAARELARHIDFVNLGLKGVSDARYRECGGTKGSDPVYRTLNLDGHAT